MKIFPALGLLLLQLAQLAAAEVVGFNRALMTSYASADASPSGGVTFASDESKLPPAGLLATLSADGYKKPSHECFAKSVVTDDEVTVLIAISKCLSNKELALIKKWVLEVTENKKLYNFGDGAKKFKFEVAAVPGDCKEASYNKGYDGYDAYDDDDDGEPGHGRGPGRKMFLSRDVQAADVARLQELFGDVGRVLGALEDKPEFKKPVAAPVSVISFVDNYESYYEVDVFERKFEISNVINFSLCARRNRDGSCRSFGKAIELADPVDIFLYNPFAVVRQLDCGDSLEGGVPVSYVDSDGKRDCFCTCPAGHTEIEEGGGYKKRKVCKKNADEVCPCVWSNHKDGYRIAVDDKAKAEDAYGRCKVTNIVRQCGVPVPFPSDNYVADARANVDAVAYVNLTSSNQDGSGGDVTGSGQFAWRDYQVHNEDKVNGLAYTAYGKYSLSLYAKDYFGDAECKGCVAIVDKFRPHATTTCPKPLCDGAPGDDANAQLTTDNLSAAQDLVDAFYDYGAKADNDACSTERCDKTCFKTQDFFERKYCECAANFDGGKSFFDVAKTIKDFTDKTEAKTNPLAKAGGGPNEAEDCEEPVKHGKCRRCAKLSTTLKEKWTDFKCGSQYDEEKCSGDDSCNFEQCLTLDGETFASATAAINSATKSASEQVLKEIQMEGYQTETQIHRSVECAALHDTYSHLECSFHSALPALIDVSASANFDLGYAKVDDFVFWRYKIDNGKWKLWGGAYPDTETFENAKTNIYLEAWTQCGIVKKFVFALHLHPHSDTNVCAFFPNMWYQTSVSRLPIADAICTYPKSDFAELTFDYRPNTGIMYARDSISMRASDIVCTIEFKDHAPVEVLHLTKDTDVVKRFAVEAINNAATADATAVTVKCAFTYKQITGKEIVKPCVKELTIRDCTKPEIDHPPNAECEYDGCAGRNLPGPYEACDGTIVKAAPEKVEYDAVLPARTYLVNPQYPTCCDGCKQETLVCTAILDLPDDDDNIKRCEPVPAYGYRKNGYDNSYTTALMSAGHALVNASQEHAAATGLLAASAMVALVALVVVKRRSAANKAAMAADDAYYPLLH
ncbi:hypothetical protein PybrP1_000257 [[Pythium] brassicae (nom. inval.)]|nr:hypothetical protein PybrP1_000257 [[Pythium] brassicae (nom. inval.)]